MELGTLKEVLSTEEKKGVEEKKRSVDRYDRFVMLSLKVTDLLWRRGRGGVGVYKYVTSFFLLGN